jgi:hypothetical protein
MIALEWSNLTTEIKNINDLKEYIRIHQIPETAIVRMRIKIPITALDGVVEEIQDHGGKVL